MRKSIFIMLGFFRVQHHITTQYTKVSAAMPVLKIKKNLFLIRRLQFLTLKNK